MIDGIQIFDNFLPDAQAQRARALDLPFRSYEFEHCTFHGISVVELTSQAPQLIAEIFPAFVPTLSFFRKSPEGQIEPHFIHTDVDMGDWSAILYLNQKPQAGDGTSFWRHRATGAIEGSIPHERSEEGRTAQGWELRERVGAKFNRLLVFPSTYFHSRTIFENWGHGDAARLVQVTFGRVQA